MSSSTAFASARDLVRVVAGFVCLPPRRWQRSAGSVRLYSSSDRSFCTSSSGAIRCSRPGSIGPSRTMRPPHCDSWRGRRRGWRSALRRRTPPEDWGDPRGSSFTRQPRRPSLWQPGLRSSDLTMRPGSVAGALCGALVAATPPFGARGGRAARLLGLRLADLGRALLAPALGVVTAGRVFGGVRLVTEHSGAALAASAAAC